MPEAGVLLINELRMAGLFWRRVRWIKDFKRRLPGHSPGFDMAAEARTMRDPGETEWTSCWTGPWIARELTEDIDQGEFC